MALVEISVWSILAEDASGSFTFSAPCTTKLVDILCLYCSEKGIDPRYYSLETNGNVILNLNKTLEEEGIKSGSLLILTNKEDKKSSLVRRGWIVAFLFLLIGCSGVICSLYLLIGPIYFPLKYGIVIDAGSSHSHLYIFSWSAVKPEEESVKVTHKCYMPGGIAHFRPHISRLDNYFSPCLHKAKSVVPEISWPRTRLTLGATAGMRILRKFDPKGAKLVMSKVRKIFSETPFKTNDSDVFIVSGQQEGIDGWTAVNYLSENLWQNDDDDDSDDYISALDLGGASVQVSTYVDDPKEWHAVNVTLFNETFSVFCKSYLCYGVVKAHYRYEYFLVNSRLNTSSYVVQSPCYPKGVDAEFTASDIHEPCIKSTSTSASKVVKMRNHFGIRERKHFLKYEHPLSEDFIKNTKPSSIANRSYVSLGLTEKETMIDKIIGNKDSKNRIHGMSLVKNGTDTSDEKIADWWNHHFINGPKVPGDSKTLFILRGTSEAEKCRRMVQSLFDYELCLKTFSFGDCMNRERIPPYTGDLVGFSSIFFRVLPLIGIDSNSSLYNFEEAVMSTCSKNLSELQADYEGVPVVFLEDLCFDVMYVYTLLSDGLSITPQKWSTIKFTGKVNHQNVEWTLGLILNQTSVTVDPSNRNENFHTLLLLIFLFTACILISLMYLFAIVQQNRKNSYQRIKNNSANADNSRIS